MEDDTEARVKDPIGWTGCPVLKTFITSSGPAVFTGQVQFAHKPPTGGLLYRVSYSDGDFEDLDQGELKAMAIGPRASGAAKLICEEEMPGPDYHMVSDPNNLQWRKVTRKFAQGTYTGTITHARNVPGEKELIYRVLYPDWDSEDLGFSQVKRLLVPEPEALTENSSSNCKPGVEIAPSFEMGSQGSIPEAMKEQVAAMDQFDELMNSIIQGNEDRAMGRQRVNQYDGNSDGGEPEGEKGEEERGPARPLLPLELDRLYQAVVKIRSLGGLGKVDMETLGMLLKMLGEVVRAGLAVDISEDGSAGAASVASLAVNGGVVGVMIMSSTGLDRRLVRDELIELTLQLLKHHLSYFASPSSGGTEKGKAKPAKKQRRVMKGIGRVYELLDLLESLVVQVRLEDRFLLMLCSSCMETLQYEMTGQDAAKLPPLQHAAMGVLQAVFHRYPDHHALLMEDVFAVLLKLPSSKKHLRTYTVEGPERCGSSTLQMVTVLVMLMVHSSVPSDPPLSSGAAAAVATQSVSGGQKGGGLASAASTSAYFIKRFLSRCSKKEEGTAFRPLLVHMVEDWLEVVLLPEWPAAELLLQALCKALMADMRSSKSSESQYCLMALELLGKVATRLAQLQREERECPTVLPKAVEKDNTDVALQEQEPSDKECICGGKAVIDSTLMLDCDRCHRWFHGSCIGIKAEEDIAKDGDQWYCCDCTMLQQLSKQKAAFAARRHKGQAITRASVEASMEVEGNEADRGDDKGWDETELTLQDVFQQLLLNHLSHRAATEPWCAQGRLLHITRWMGEAVRAKQDEKWSYLREQWELPSSFASLKQEWLRLTVTRSATLQMSRRLFIDRELGMGFDLILRHIMALLGAEASSLRCRVVKCIAGVIAADPVLMGKGVVCAAMTNRFLDEAISVREAAVSLVGSHVLASNSNSNSSSDGDDLLERYYNGLMERLVDRGVSVRKAVVRIFRGCLQSQPHHPRRAALCRALAERASAVKEEDTIRDLIRDTFREIWFCETSKPGDSESLQLLATTPASVTPYGASSAAPRDEEPPEDEEEPPQDEQVTVSALQMMEVVSGMENTSWLVKLLEGLLHGPTEGSREKKDGSKRREVAKRRSEALVGCFIEFMLRLDEGDYPYAGSSGPLSTPASQLVAVVSMLYVFCKANPSFLVKHMEVLYPYLKAENGLSFEEESQVCLLITGMTNLVLPLLKQPDLDLLRGLSEDLVAISFRFGSKVILSAVECLSRIVLISHDPAQIMGLLQKCYAYLHKYHATKTANAPNASRLFIQRALIIVGYICRVHNLPPAPSEEDPHDLYHELPARLPPTGAKRATYELLRKYLLNKEGDYQLQIKALQGLGGLLMGAPRMTLLAETHGIISHVLKSPDEEVLLQALHLFTDILVAEEERVESGAARERMAVAGVSIAARVQGDQDAESSVAGGVAQLHVEHILLCLFHEWEDIREVAVGLLGVMLRQGLVNPLDVVPHLTALQGETEPEIKAEATRQLLTEDEKGRDFMRSRLMDGVFTALVFQKSVLGAPRPVAMVDKANTSVFGSLYSVCMRPSRSLRYSCLRQFLGMFEEAKAGEIQRYLQQAKHRIGGACNGTTEKRVRGTGRSQALDLEVLSYLTSTLAHLPYEVQEEPLFLIFHINRLLSLQGAHCAEKLKGMLRRRGVAIPAHDSDDDDEVDDKDDDSAAGNVTATKGKRSGISDEQEHDLMVQCSVAASFCLLLRLKHFLKQVHGLSDSRCQTYNPSDGSKATERALNRSGTDEIPLFDATTTHQCSTSEGMVSQLEELCRLLQEDPQ
ncbi:unnamed protein product, partial [Chrysoparadoxa australica]